MGLLNNIGDALTDGLGLNPFSGGATGDEFSVLKGHYLDSESAEDPQAFIEKKGGVPGSYSLFNPFRIFRYSGFGSTDHGYQRELHFDSKGVPSNPAAGVGGLLSSLGVGSFAQNAVDAVDAASSVLKSFTETKKMAENPTASDIIRWSHKGEAQAPVPYSPQDFLWCKYYGKVPNNRLVTLRRYPIPIEDNIHIHDNKVPLVPIAQAVTWYGNDLGNDLNKIFNISWGLKWAEKTAKVQDIIGNELSIDDIAGAIGVKDAERDKVIQILKTHVFSGHDTVDVLKLSGYDTEIQDYIKQAYGDDGPYWNRILGPVNAVDRTMIRDRGFESQQDVVINFEYSLRSHGGINPKIAFLDLLTNFLSLTYNNAPFWGGGARYFEKTGVTAPNFGMENDMLSGDIEGAIVNGAETLAALSQAGINGLVDFAKDIAGGKYNNADGTINAEAVKAQKDAEAGQIKQNYVSTVGKALTPRLGKLMRKPLIYRAILDGRAVGEWHLTIGNPMTPMIMMGNMILKNVKMELGEVLGIDDFPTEFKFTVTLGHGRPRAKQDIESMFNLGNGGMGYTQMAPPSSAKNSYGESNTQKLNAAYQGINPEDPEAQGVASDGKGATMAGGAKSQIGEGEGFSINSGGSLEQTVARYARQVGNMYGGFYANSPVLTDYFKNLKTKD
jgi:hypothetical protein